MTIGIRILSKHLVPLSTRRFIVVEPSLKGKRDGDNLFLG